VAGDTPDSYLVRIKKNAEMDAPAMPVQNLPKRDENGRYVRKADSKELEMVTNPKYDAMVTEEELS